MKKTFVILITVAILGILAASVAPAKQAIGTTTSRIATPSTPVASSTNPVVASASQYKDGTFTGSTASNRYDDIQVAVTITGGKLTAIKTPVLRGDSGRSDAINSYTVPQLIDQAMASQGSTIDGVSGASYTTEAYSSSLQSALDQAKA